MSIFARLAGSALGEWLGFSRSRLTEPVFQAPSWQSLLERGFRSWADAPPPHGNVVEFYRVWDGDSFDADPADLSPHFNVHGLYWRPVGPMLNITAQGNVG